VRRYGQGDTAVDALRGVSVDIAEGRLTAVMARAPGVLGQREPVRDGQHSRAQRVERTRELVMLRTIRHESVITALIGAAERAALRTTRRIRACVDAEANHRRRASAP
jgi:hypothetical protein